MHWIFPRVIAVYSTLMYENVSCVHKPNINGYAVRYLHGVFNKQSTLGLKPNYTLCIRMHDVIALPVAYPSRRPYQICVWMVIGNTRARRIESAHMIATQYGAVMSLPETLLLHPVRLCCVVLFVLYKNTQTACVSWLLIFHGSSRVHELYA